MVPPTCVTRSLSSQLFSALSTQHTQLQGTRFHGVLQRKNTRTSIGSLLTVVPTLAPTASLIVEDSWEREDTDKIVQLVVFAGIAAPFNTGLHDG